MAIGSVSGGRKGLSAPERTEVAGDPTPGEAGDRFSAMSRRPGERWGHFVERVGNAFGLVLLLVIVTYVLGSLVPYRGWTAALITAVAAGAAVIALASADARRWVVHAAALLALG